MNNEDITLALEESEQATMGFWLYLISDCLIFAGLFATYAVLANATASGPAATDFFDLRSVLQETFILLSSSFTASLAFYAARRGAIRKALIALVSTLGLGIWFLSIELTEFAKLIGDGAGPSTSAFLSSYFGLLGAHGLHVLLGSIWLVVLIFQIRSFGLRSEISRRISLFTLFWHFLDIIWIFIFTFVYLFAFL